MSAQKLRTPKEQDTRSKSSRGQSRLKLTSCQAGAQHAVPLQGEGEAARAGEGLARIGRFLAVDVFVFDVALGVGVYGGLGCDGGGAVFFAGGAHYHAALRGFLSAAD